MRWKYIDEVIFVFNQFLGLQAIFFWFEVKSIKVFIVKTVFRLLAFSFQQTFLFWVKSIKVFCIISSFLDFRLFINFFGGFGYSTMSNALVSFDHL
jgi:hypothetical protein